MSLAYKIEIFKKGYIHDDEYYNSRWLCSFLPEEISKLLKDDELKKNFDPKTVYDYVDNIINQTNSEDDFDKLLNQYQSYYLQI